MNIKHSVVKAPVKASTVTAQEEPPFGAESYRYGRHLLRR